MTNEQTRGASNMTTEITRFVRFIAILSITMGAVVFGLALAINPHQSVSQLIVYGFITIIVANVPQGLPGSVC